MHLKRRVLTLDNLSLSELDTRTMEEPVITSPLETDLYKWTMAGMFCRFPEYANSHVTWGFKNRTRNVKLADTVTENEFMEQWNHVTSTRMTGIERNYLAGITEDGTRVFPDFALDAFERIRVPEASYTVTNDRQPDIQVGGKWLDSTMCEIPMLKIVSALHYRSLLKKMSRVQRFAVYSEGIKRLCDMTNLFKENPHVTWLEFGNRRSFSPAWLEVAVSFFAEALPPSQFIGTSSVSLARKLGIKSKGTIAHEASMCLTALMFDGTKESIAGAMTKLHSLWWDTYGEAFSIRLPDTYGTQFAMSALPDDHFRDWRGARIDSAEPFVGVEWEILKYQSLRIDPREKTALCSDGLNPQMMVDIANKFNGQIQVPFGMGTRATNNLGLPTLSIVCKPIMINGLWTVKLSDNLEKRTGDSATADQYMSALGYHAQNHNVQEV